MVNLRMRSYGDRSATSYIIFSKNHDLISPSGGRPGEIFFMFFWWKWCLMIPDGRRWLSAIPPEVQTVRINKSLHKEQDIASKHNHEAFQLIWTESECSSASFDAIATQFKSIDIHLSVFYLLIQIIVRYVWSLLSGPRGGIADNHRRPSGIMRHHLHQKNMKNISRAPARGRY